MKQVDYRWHVAELMARHGMHNTTDLAPRLRDYGIELSPSQVYRLVTQTPDRVSPPGAGGVVRHLRVRTRRPAHLHLCGADVPSRRDRDVGDRSEPRGTSAAGPDHPR